MCQPFQESNQARRISQPPPIRTPNPARLQAFAILVRVLAPQPIPRNYLVCQNGASRLSLFGTHHPFQEAKRLINLLLTITAIRPSVRWLWSYRKRGSMGDHGKSHLPSVVPLFFSVDRGSRDPSLDPRLRRGGAQGAILIIPRLTDTLKGSPWC